ncbi:hypothetical protein CLOM_g9134 [Closterium sp. NIES-68]|nr:hypothetical protein CLOM_g9134 [Closterium sp. NIES-68]
MWPDCYPPRHNFHNGAVGAAPGAHGPYGRIQGAHQFHAARQQQQQQQQPASYPGFMNGNFQPSFACQSAPTSPSKPLPVARRTGSGEAAPAASDAGSAYAESSASGDDESTAGWSMAGDDGRSGDAFHVIHKVPVGDSPYVRAKHVQLVDKDPVRAIALFWSAINAGDRVDSALKDMAIVMKQQSRPEEAIEAIRSLRHKCSEVAQESLDNVLLDLFKRCGRLDDQVALLKHKLDMIRQGVAFNGKRTKTARSQGKKFQVSIEQEATRLLGNLGWAYMQQGNYVAAESVYRKALRVEADSNKVCNLGICLMKQGRIVEARALLESVSPNSDPRWGSESHIKSYERAQSMLVELETSAAAAEASKDGSAASGGNDASAVPQTAEGKSAGSTSSSDKDPQVKPAFHGAPGGARGMGGMGMGMGLARSSFQRHSSYLCEFLGAPDTWDSLMADGGASGGSAPAEGAAGAAGSAGAAPLAAAGGSSAIAGMQSRGPPDAPQQPQQQPQRQLQAPMQGMRRPPAAGAMARTMSLGAGCSNPLARSMSFGGADPRGLSCLKPNAPEFMPGSFGPVPPPPGHGSAPPFMHGDGRRTLTASRSLPPLQIPSAGFGLAVASPSLVSPLGPMSSGSLSCGSSMGGAPWDDGLVMSAFDNDDDVLCEMVNDSYQPSAAAISVAAGVWASQKPPTTAHFGAAMRKVGGFPAPGQRAVFRGTENVPQYMAGGAPIGAGGPGARRPLVFGCENPAPMAAKAQMVAGGLMGGSTVGMQMGAEMGAGMGMTTVMGERTNLEPPAQFMGAWGAVAQGKGAWGMAGEGLVEAEEKAKQQQQQQMVGAAEVGGSGMKRNRVPTPVKAAAPKGERRGEEEGDVSGAQEGGPVVPKALWEMLGFTGSPDKLLLDELKGNDSAKKLMGAAAPGERQQGSERRTLFADCGDAAAAAVAGSGAAATTLTSPTAGSSHVEVKRPRRLRIFQEMTYVGAAA